MHFKRQRSVAVLSNLAAYFQENTKVKFIQYVLATLAITIASLSHSAPFPDKPIRLIVPFTAGGNVDNSARTISQGLSEQLGQSVIVDNKPGANTLIGAEFVARANPDGYTLLLGTPESLAINPHVYKRINYDPLKDLTAVGLVGNFPFALVVNLKLPAKNIKEFVALAKSMPGKMNYSSWGIGSTSQITFERFNQVAGIELVHIPFQGAAPAITAIAADEVQAMMVPLSVALPQAAGGKVKILGITTSQRFASAPDILTFQEQGYPVVMSGWHLIVAPNKTSPSVLQTLNRNLNKALETQATKEALIRIGIEPSPGSIAQANKLIQTEYERWGKTAKDAGIAIEKSE
nr:tripartite tricarboxylate transporter substrate binding protein [Polynucleobacter sp. UB-Piko-W3]